MKEILIKWLLSALFSITAEQWATVCNWVAQAAGKAIDGKLKNELVRGNIAKLWPDLKAHTVDALVGMAVAWQKKLGKA